MAERDTGGQVSIRRYQAGPWQHDEEARNMGRHTSAHVIGGKKAPWNSYICRKRAVGAFQRATGESRLINIARMRSRNSMRNRRNSCKQGLFTLALELHVTAKGKRMRLEIAQRNCQRIGLPLSGDVS